MKYLFAVFKKGVAIQPVDQVWAQAASEEIKNAPAFQGLLTQFNAEVRPVVSGLGAVTVAVDAEHLAHLQNSIATVFPEFCVENSATPEVMDDMQKRCLQRVLSANFGGSQPQPTAP